MCILLNGHDLSVLYISPLVCEWGKFDLTEQQCGLTVKGV